MELKEFFHMNEGDGELSYSKNSCLQKGVSLMSQPVLESAIQSLLIKNRKEDSYKVLKVADFGCGVGQVPLDFALIVRENVKNKCKELNLTEDDNDQVPEIEIYYNDLPSNDFNLLFQDLMSSKLKEPNKKDENGIPLCFLMGTPGSYYGRLFPRNSLHLVHANYTRHWLSQAPPGLYNQEDEPINKGNIYISETSPKIAAKSYLAQFEQDFSQFLKCRSQELVCDGRMLLPFRGRPSPSNVATWQPWVLKIFANAFSCLISQGLIEEKKLDSLDIPYFGACEEEIEGIIKREGSFKIEIIKTMEHSIATDIVDIQERVDVIGKLTRALSEALITRHFGHETVDPLYNIFNLLLFEHLAILKPNLFYTIIVLLKRN